MYGENLLNLTLEIRLHLSKSLLKHLGILRGRALVLRVKSHLLQISD